MDEGMGQVHAPASAFTFIISWDLLANQALHTLGAFLTNN